MEKRKDNATIIGSRLYIPSREKSLQRGALWNTEFKHVMRTQWKFDEMLQRIIFEL
jgi:hypothetical protein